MVRLVAKRECICYGRKTTDKTPALRIRNRVGLMLAKVLISCSKSFKSASS